MEIGRIAEAGLSKAQEIKQPTGNISESFSEILTSLESHSKLQVVQEQVLRGGTFTPRELLLLQVQFGRFNMQVELLSKVAESANATIRRLQGGGA